jgi:xylulokinase
MGLLLGIDLGTTGCKAAVYAQEGNLLGESYLEYGLITRSPTMIEQDPRAWWNLTCRAVELVLDQAQVNRNAVRGLALSSQGISFVLLDASGRLLGNAISWLDTRAAEESAAIVERYPAERLFALTGKRAAPFYVLPKLLWLRRKRPELWRRVHKVLMGHDYLVYRFCGEAVTDHSMASGTLLYDLQALDWSGELLEAFEIPVEILPAVRWSGTPVGVLKPEIAEQLHLRPDTVVSVGGQDQKCAALGVGIQDNTATLSLGTASAITRVVDRPVIDPQMRVPTFTFVVPSRWVLEGVILTGGGSLRWYRETICGNVPYTKLDEEARPVPRGAEGVLFYPHLSGAGSPHWQSQARGIFCGLALATTRAHLTRALLEGVAYQIRENLSVMEELAGPEKRAIVFGGGAKSAVWRDIIGDVINRPLAWTSTVETASRGASMLAGLGCGLFPTLEYARDAMVGSMIHREPDPEAARAYDQHFDRYARVEASLLESMQGLYG